MLTDNAYLAGKGMPAVKAAASAPIRVERSGTTVRITLDRPERRNATTPELMDALGAALDDCAGEQTRVVVLTGAGQAFCGGADLNRPGIDDYGQSSPARAPAPGEPTVLERHYHPVLCRIRELAKPVVAAVNGPAVGVGCSLALCCDIVIARRSAFFALPFVNVGLVPDGGASVWMTARVGVARATMMAMFGERVPAEQAHGYGMVDLLVEDDAFDAEVGRTVARLAAGPTAAYAGVKQLMNARVYAGYREQMLLEARLQAQLVLTEDFQEGVRAFRDRRAPRFQGH
jgi:2-(1,2-epoxy-1,2-dihydrophenyl)acetyl-CoA isomerase